MSCIPASHSMITGLNQVDGSMEEGQAERRGSRAYQIFPESAESDSDSYSEEMIYRRERLPSIVVEPTEQSEVESGELCWPPNGPRGCEGEDDSISELKRGFVGDEAQEDMGPEEGTISRKSSMGPVQDHLQLSRLTPPPSLTCPEDNPPCLRS